jgi:hypothetical protein
MTTKTGWVWHDAWGQSAADACFADFAIASIRLLARRTAQLVSPMSERGR